MNHSKNNFKSWMQALRLRTLPLSIAGILTGSGYAFSNNQGNRLILLFALLTTILFQIVSNLANDLGDSIKGADNSERIGPMRAVQSGEISKKQMRNAVIFTSVLSFISASLLLWFSKEQLTTNSLIFYGFLALFCILAAIAYTIGKNAYGYKGLGDLMVFVFFGIVSVLGVYPLFTGGIDYLLIFPAFTIGLLSSAVLNLNNLRDQENDAKVNKRTMVVKLGFEKAKNYHAFLILGSLISWISFLLFCGKPALYISLLPFVFLLRHLVIVGKIKEMKQFDSQLKPVALSTFFISLLFILSVIFFQ